MTEEKFVITCKKSQVEKYDVRTVGQCGWAYITIDPSGELTVQSDFGNYCYIWRSFGENFKEFLCKLNMEYFMGKCDPQSDTHIDWEYTQKYMLKKVLEFRRENADKDIFDSQYFSWSEARELYDFIKDEYCPTIQSVNNCFAHDSLFQVVFPYADEDLKFKIIPDPLHVRFWEEIWKPFCESVLKEEIGEEIKIGKK